MTPLREIVEMLLKIPEWPWHVAGDKAADTTAHKNSGLALVDTGRTEDWPIARLCEWRTAEFIACSPRWLAELVVMLVEEKRAYLELGCSGCKTRDHLPQALSDPDFDITPEQFEEIKRRLGG